MQCNYSLPLLQGRHWQGGFLCKTEGLAWGVLFLKVRMSLLFLWIVKESRP